MNINTLFITSFLSSERAALGGRAGIADVDQDGSVCAVCGQVGGAKDVCIRCEAHVLAGGGKVE